MKTKTRERNVFKKTFGKNSFVNKYNNNAAAGYKIDIGFDLGLLYTIHTHNYVIVQINNVQ